MIMLSSQPLYQLKRTIYHFKADTQQILFKKIYMAFIHYFFQYPPYNTVELNLQN